MENTTPVEAEAIQKVDIRNIATTVQNPTNSTDNYSEKITEGDASFLNLVKQRNLNKYSEPTKPSVPSPEDVALVNALPGILEVGKQEPVEIIENDPEPNTEDEEYLAEEPVSDPLEEKRKTKTENLKNLRFALKESRDRISDLETQINSKDKELEKLAEMDSLKEQLQEKEEKLQKLKQYEDVVSLYGTEGFKEKFYDSVDALRNAAVEVANDYGVSEDVLDTAFNITNQRQLNEYLGQYFDTFAIQDIRTYIKEAQKIISDRNAAEASPYKARELLLKTVANRKAAERVQNRDSIKNTGTTVWADVTAAYSNKDSGIPILQEKVGNKEHNTLRTTILDSASKAFGNTLAVLADNGLKELPVNTAKAIVARYQLGEAAAHAIVQSEHLHKENLELKAELAKFTKYDRPLSNSKTPSVTSNKDLSELKGKSLANYIYSKAESKIAS